MNTKMAIPQSESTEMTNQTAKEPRGMDGSISTNASLAVLAVRLDNRKMADASPKDALIARSVSCPVLGRQKHQPNVGQILRPGRFEALTPAQRDQLEQERTRKLLGWFERRKAAKQKAKASSCKFLHFVRWLIVEG